ncbi:hypothetical protein H312_03227, partial [Anncaliia algerae PRA339]
EVRTLFAARPVDQKDIIATFKILIAIDLHYLIKEDSDSEKIIDQIFKETFPSKNLFMYENRLKTIKINNFKTIKEFKSYFNTQVRYANYCLGSKGKITEREQFAYLEQALPNYILKKLYFENKHTVKDAFELLELEEDFSQRFKTNAITTTHTTEAVKQTKGNNKWCKYHRSKYHNTDECLGRKKYSNNNTDFKIKKPYNKKEEKNNLNNFIDEPQGISDEINLKLDTDHGDIKALVDTGAKLCYISKTKAEKNSKKN